MKAVCRNCQFWHTGQLLSAVCPDGTVMSEQGPRKVLHTYVLGTCAQVLSPWEVKKERHQSGEYDVVFPLDSIIADKPQHENQWGSGGVNPPMFGPDFGCIHFAESAE